MAMAQLQEQEPLDMSEAEYLEFEEKSEIKHEFVSGKVYAMAGASWKHVMICQSTGANLYNQLTGKSCVVESNDLRLKVESKKVSYRYPDLMVICGEPNFIENRVDTIDNPTLIIEVLSPATALEDHNAKLDEYTRLESVQEYVLISQHEAKVEVYTRQESEKWWYTPIRGLDASIELASINCTLALSKIYEKVNFETSRSDE